MSEKNKQQAKLFYSYSHQDERYKKEMEKTLYQLKANGKLDTWHDRKLSAGQNISEEINKYIASANIVVFLVSRDFLASKPCMEEWNEAKKNPHSRRIPIIVKGCAWADFDDMQKLLALPKDGKPIDSYPSEDKAWLEVYEGLKKVIDEIIPQKNSSGLSATTKSDWNQSPYASDLAIANLLGAWDDNSEADREIIKHLTTVPYTTWIQGLRESLQSADSPVSLKNGRWSITERKAKWQALGARLFDDNLDTFKQCAVTVLTDRDSQFDLPADKRFAAALYGKGVKYSSYLRKGMAESLALLGTMPDDLTHCLPGKRKDIAALTIREIFKTADWVLWGSLNDLLPTLAEAAPGEFLGTVETALKQSPCPFDELFSQERSGIFGTNYLTGLLDALETLAWDARYLVRVCVVLGDLASHEPGGRWVKQPVDSLKTILLPWRPQTLALIEKRKAAVRTLCDEHPEIAFRLNMGWLSDQYQVSRDSHKPLWRNIIPDNWTEGVTPQEYRKVASFYADCAVSIADNDVPKLGALIDQFHNLPQPSSFKKLIEVLSSNFISKLPEDERSGLWDRLTKLISQHRQSPEAECGLNEDLLLSLEEVAKKLAPEQPNNLYRHLFSGDIVFLGDGEEKQKKIAGHRREAVQAIRESGGVEAIIKFAESVESPGQVGYALGGIADPEIDTFLLPEYLGLENHKLSRLIFGYVDGRHRAKDWTWAKEIDKSGWSNGQIGEFLSYLPFTEEAWHYAAEWLGSDQGHYWQKANVRVCSSGDMSIVIDKLIEYKQLPTAIRCMARMHRTKQSIDPNQCVKALLDIPRSLHSLHSSEIRYIVVLIKMLQKAQEVDPEDLFRVEWAYLPLLDGTNSATPVLLEKYLSDRPEFFCEVIHSVCLSERVNHTTDEPSKEKQDIASNAFSLLKRRWRIPPGMQKDGSFDDSRFVAWLKRVKKICKESGHLKVALSHVGMVLIHSPPAADGLWINKTVAKALNAEDVEEMRRGFFTGKLNSRGAHRVDPTGKAEQALADQYRQDAEDVENAGYWRFAKTMRELSEFYECEAHRIQEGHKE